MSPPLPIEEGRLRFEFDARWQAAVKWDDSLAYRKGIGTLPDTKAVDILCLSKGRCVLIEVKDFRGHRIENKPRVASGVLNVLKQRLHWLTPNVLVTSVREVSKLPGVQVSNLPHP